MHGCDVLNKRGFTCPYVLSKYTLVFIGKVWKGIFGHRTIFSPSELKWNAMLSRIIQLMLLTLQMIDLLHPLATVHWEEWIGSPYTVSKQLVLLKGKIYLPGLYMYDPNVNLHIQLESPCYTGYGISTYRSQLVLVGGLDSTTKQPTNKVWVSDDGSKWEPSLPPLPTASFFHCCLDSLVATANPRPQQAVEYSVWKEFLVPSDSSLLLTLENQMVAAGNISPSSLGPGCGSGRTRALARIERTPKICVYSPFTQTWVQVGDFLDGYVHRVFSGRSLTSPSSGKLIFAERRSSLFKAAFKSKNTTLTIHFCNEVAREPGPASVEQWLKSRDPVPKGSIGVGTDKHRPKEPIF